MTIEVALLAAVAAVLALYGVLIVARWPGLILVAVPILLWPSTFDGQPVRQGIVFLLILGTMVSSRTHVGRLRPLVLALLALTGLLVVSHYLQPATLAMLPSEARNSMVTFALNVWLVLVFALVRPSLVTAVKTFALSGVVAAAYSAAIGDAGGGRLVAGGLNPNSAGHAAALATLACFAAYRVSGQLRYLFAAAIPFYVVLLAQSRGGLLVLGVGIVVAWVIAKRGAARWLGVAIAAVVGFALTETIVALTQRYLLFNRDVTTIETDSRFELLEVAGRVIASNPLGAGYGRFPDLSRPYLGIPLNSHNDWLRIAAEVGIAAVALLIFVTLARARSLPTPAKPILVAAVASMALGNVGVDLRVSLPLWAFAGLAWAHSVGDDRRRAARAGSTRACT